MSAPPPTPEPPPEVVRRLHASGAMDVHGWGHLGGGHEADVYLTSALFGGSQQELAVRVCRGASSDRVWLEAEVMRSLHRHGFPVPPIVCVSTPNDPTGRPFTVMERVHGRSLGDDYWSGDPTRRASARASLLHLHHRLHDLDASRVLPPHARTRTLAGDLAWLETELTQQDNRVRDAFAPIVDRVRSAVPHVQRERTVVVHGDFHYNNVLIGEDGAATVIDWSSVCAADPRTDLAWLRLVTGDPDIAAYSSGAGSTEDVDVFETVATAQVVLEVLKTLTDPGSDPGAIHRARSGADHTRSAVARLHELTTVSVTRMAMLVDAAVAAP